MRKYLFLFLVASFAFTVGFMHPSSLWKLDSNGDLVPKVARNLTTGTVRVEVTGTSTLTEAQCKRTLVTNYGMASNGDTTLPAISSSTDFTVMVEAASQAWSLKPPSGEAFVLNGVALDADDEIDVGNAAGAAGDSGHLIRIRTGASTYKWYFYSVYGAHTDGGAS